MLLCKGNRRDNMYKRVLTIQDISCVGQCSLTVALPIISACGIETAVLPSAVLSTHTAGFKGFTFRDLSCDMQGICEHWEKEKITFDGVYTGYLGSIEQIDTVKDIVKRTLKKDAPFIVDPAMADNGKLYPAFDIEYANKMKELCALSDFIIPNITEACYLTGVEYREEYDEKYIKELTDKLLNLGAKCVVLTGVTYKKGKTGVLVTTGEHTSYYEHEKLSNSCHGTGDIYASAFVGALIRGKTAEESAKIAADYTVSSIEETAKIDNHWYGACFELALPKLISMINE